MHPELSERLPLDWVSVFGVSAPIVVEIGFGNGEYISALARENPDKCFVGFEVSITSMKKAYNKVKDLENVRLVISDARFGIREFFGPRTVERVVMNFPIPWDKKSHARRRVIVPEFFDTLANVLVDGGIFELVTDVKWYAELAVQTGTEKGYFRCTEFVENPNRSVKTKYERKWLSQGKVIYQVLLKKVRHTEVARLIGGVHEMPHVKCRVDPNKIPTLEGRVLKARDKVVVVKGVYKALNGEAYLLKIISSDGDFQQHYYLVAYEEGTPEADRWIIKLDSASNPYRTPAVRWSVRAIARELEPSAMALKVHEEV